MIQGQLRRGRRWRLAASTRRRVRRHGEIILVERFHEESRIGRAIVSVLRGILTAIVWGGSAAVIGAAVYKATR